MPKTGYFVLHANVKPKVTAGSYDLVTEQTGLPFEVATEHTHIKVSSPRYTMPTDQILSTFPPANAEGAFGDRLPQIVLKRRTLPWERNPEEKSQVSDTPWLALVVVAEGEAQLSTATAVANCMTPAIPLLEPGDQDVEMNQLLHEDEYLPLRAKAREEGDSAFRADIGAPAVRELLGRLDIKKLADVLRAGVSTEHRFPVRNHGDALERERLLPDRNEVAGRKRDAREAAFGSLTDVDEPVEIRQRHAFGRVGPAGAPHHRGRADAEREREHGRGRERGAVPQLSDGVAHVLPEVLERAGAASVARDLLEAHHPAERDACPSPSFWPGDTAALELRGLHVEVEAHLVVHSALVLADAREQRQPPKDAP